jgi:hypothetical protein
LEPEVIVTVKEEVKVSAEGPEFVCTWSGWPLQELKLCKPPPPPPPQYKLDNTVHNVLIM